MEKKKKEKILSEAVEVHSPSHHKAALAELETEYNEIVSSSSSWTSSKWVKFLNNKIVDSLSVYDKTNFLLKKNEKPLTKSINSYISELLILLLQTKTENGQFKDHETIKGILRRNF